MMSLHTSPDHDEIRVLGLEFYLALSFSLFRKV